MPARCSLRLVLGLAVFMSITLSGECANADYPGPAPDAAEWITIATDPVHRDEVAAGSPMPSCPDVISFKAAHGGDNRIYLRVEFAEDFPTTNTLLQLYLDTDNDPSTGRKGPVVEGTDRMVTIAMGKPRDFSFGEAGWGKRTRVWIEGNLVIVQDDPTLPAELISRARASGAKSMVYHFRARLLCRLDSDSRDADEIPWSEVAMKIDLDKRKPTDPGGKKPRVLDLAAWRDAGDRVQVRFTTAEVLSAEVIGGGKCRNLNPDGMRRNHSWEIAGLPATEGAEYLVVLTDETGSRASDERFPSPRPEVRPDEPEGRRAVGVSIRVDGELLAARRNSLKPVAWPVSGGIPLPKGALYSESRARLLDSRGKERSAWIEALSRWSDGSIRWLLVEFVAELPGEIIEGFKLEYGRDVRRAQPSPDDKAASEMEPPWVETLAWPGGTAGSNGTERLRLERGGPVHRIYSFEGRYGKGDSESPFGYRARVHVYPGVPFVRIEHTLRVLDGDPMTRLRSLRLCFGEEKGEPSPSASRQAQITISESETGTAADPARGTDRLPGFLPAGATDRLVVVRNFAENWPKEMVGEKGSTRLDLFPALRDGQYDDRPEPREILYYCFDGIDYILRRGLEKTHEILYAGSAGEKPDAASLSFWLDNPPVLAAPPEWNCSTGAAGKLVTEADSPIPEFEAHVRNSFDLLAKRRVEVKEYGLMNFGDWHGERERNWGNLEYDLAHGLWIEWLRTGDYRFFLRAEQAIAHMSDIDIAHFDPNPTNVGKMWTHALGHTGGYYPEGSFGMEHYFTLGLWDTGHTWDEGLFHLYLATGNRRFYENGILVADQLARYASTDFRFVTERQGGWPIIALVAAYEVTGDPFYLNAAKLIARQVVVQQDPKRGVWSARIGECRHDPPHHGGKTFMAGVLTTGLTRLHRVLPTETEDDRALKEAVGKALVRGCDWMLNEAWIESESGFFYAQCPTFYGKPCGASPWLTCEPLAYASEISGDGKYLETAKKAVARGMTAVRPGLGKTLAMEIRGTPYFLAAISAESGE